MNIFMNAARLARAGWPALALAVFTLLGACTSGTRQTADDRPAAPPRLTAGELADTRWQAVSILGKPVGATIPTLEFGQDGQVTGNAGCNRYNGETTIEDSSMEFGLLATTRKMCEPAVSGQETVFLEALGVTRSWDGSRDTLELIDEENAVVLRLQRRTD